MKTVCFCLIRLCFTVPWPYDAYVAEAFDNDPAMKLLRKQTEQAKNEVRLAKAESLPHVSLYASNTLARPVSRTMADLYNNNWKNTLARPVSRTMADLYNNNWNIGLSVSYPLSSLYKNNHRVKETKLAVLMNQNAEEQKMQQFGTHAGDFHLLSTGTGVRKIVKNKNYGRTENKTRQIEEITDA